MENFGSIDPKNENWKNVESLLFLDRCFCIFLMHSSIFGSIHVYCFALHQCIHYWAGNELGWIWMGLFLTQL